MAIATSTIIAAAAVAAAGASIAGGVMANNAAGEQADLARSDAAARAEESARVADRQSMIEQRNIDETTQRQKLAFLASGVTLEGSPLLKMEETRRLGAENIEEIKKGGQASADAQIAEGRRTAQSAKASGRQALIGGISGAASSLSRLA